MFHFECLGQENGPIQALIKRTSLVIPTASDLVDSLNTTALFVNYVGVRVCSWLSIIFIIFDLNCGGFGPAGMSLSHRALASPCGGPGACKLTFATSCFLRHIGVAGFWVKRAVYQEAVRLGRVVFRATHGS